MINGLHSSLADFIMFWISNKLIWIPFYCWLLYLIIKAYKKESFFIIILAIILICITDQVSTNVFKVFFHRLRPCHALGDLVHLVNGYCGGPYGFISSHAANSFGIAVFIIYLLRKKYKYIIFIMLFWAVIISYSRIYLGAHYPADVTCGAVFGSFIGWIVSKIHLKFKSNFNFSKN